jgi:hypothetical protein
VLLTQIIDESLAPRGCTENEFVAASRGYKRLLGYPIDKEGEHMMIVEISSTGNWTDFVCPSENTNSGRVVQCTKLPGRTVHVLRRPKAKVEADFRQRQRIAAQLEMLHILAPLQKLSTDSSLLRAGNVEFVEGAAEKAGGESVDAKFKMDAEVECDYEGKGEFWPCVVRRVNDDRSYDIEYTG